MINLPRVVKVNLPEVGDEISECEILRWFVKEGDEIKKSQPLVEVLADKANVEIQSPVSGKVIKLLASEGEVVKVGSPILEAEVIEEVEEHILAPSRREERVKVFKVKASPAVRKLARELGVDLTKIRGSGRGGIITRSDVMKYYEEVIERRERKVEERMPLRGLRRRIAERMIEAKSRIPHTYLIEEADVTELVRLRDSLRPLAEEKGVKLTYLPFLIKAVVKALMKYPLMNSSLDEERGEIVIKHYYNIGVAVDTEQGLIVPNIKDADKKGLFQIARELSELVEKARKGKLTLDEVRGGTFSITNLGSVGITTSIPIINPPEAAILGFHKITKRPSYVGDEVKPRYIVNLSLSFDHRIVDGAYAGRFLTTVKYYLENPVMMFASEKEFE